MEQAGHGGPIKKPMDLGTIWTETKHCERCKRTDVKLVRDHDHATGLFRGWVCSPCNLAVGVYEHQWNSQEEIERTVDYLCAARAKHSRFKESRVRILARSILGHAPERHYGFQDTPFYHEELWPAAQRLARTPEFRELNAAPRLERRPQRQRPATKVTEADLRAAIAKLEFPGAAGRL